MVEANPVRETLGIVGIGKEMLHSPFDVLLEALAGFKFPPSMVSRWLRSISKLFFMVFPSLSI